MMYIFTIQNPIYSRLDESWGKSIQFPNFLGNWRDISMCPSLSTVYVCGCVSNTRAPTLGNYFIKLDELAWIPLKD